MSEHFWLNLSSLLAAVILKKSAGEDDVHSPLWSCKLVCVCVETRFPEVLLLRNDQVEVWHLPLRVLLTSVFSVRLTSIK